jgi:hypothetical protein
MGIDDKSADFHNASFNIDLKCHFPEVGGQLPHPLCPPLQTLDFFISIVKLFGEEEELERGLRPLLNAPETIPLKPPEMPRVLLLSLKRRGKHGRGALPLLNAPIIVPALPRP